MSRWQAKLEHRQGFLARIVDIGAELFAMAAACSRAEMLRVEDAAKGESAYELADAFCRQARRRVEALSDQLWVNTDEHDGAIAARVLDDSYTWLEEGVLDPSIEGPWIAEPAPGPSILPNLHRKIRRQ